jgi:hypothetical protein
MSRVTPNRQSEMKGAVHTMTSQTPEPSSEADTQRRADETNQPQTDPDHPLDPPEDPEHVDADHPLDPPGGWDTPTT